jgi:hypothetical protein
VAPLRTGLLLAERHVGAGLHAGFALQDKQGVHHVRVSILVYIAPGGVEHIRRW